MHLRIGASTVAQDEYSEIMFMNTFSNIDIAPVTPKEVIIEPTVSQVLIPCYVQSAEDATKYCRLPRRNFL